MLLLGTVEWTWCELNYLGSGRHKRFNQSFELQHSNSKFEYQRNGSERLPSIGFQLREIKIRDRDEPLDGPIYGLYYIVVLIRPYKTDRPCRIWYNYLIVIWIGHGYRTFQTKWLNHQV